MTQDMDDKKRAQKAEHRVRLIEAELNAVKGSKAYRVSKKIGAIKNRIKADPIGLTKKVVKTVITNPKKATHLLRSASRGADMSQSVVEQNTKYQEWILLNEPDETELIEQRRDADQLEKRPLISIITPVFNPPLDVFEELVESVLEQTYDHFELCLGNFGDDPKVEDMIARYAKIDSRIKHFTFSENKGIAGNSNQILEKATGEYIALLDHDDTISPDALYENVKLLNEKPYDFIYSDKDKIDEKGNRFDPLFKPEFSPEMLLNINYLTHLNIMKTSIVRKVGGWDPVTDGAQDWDLFMRVIDESKLIGFIPKVLYHWRVIATSTAMSIETKPYALANQCKAVDKHLLRNKLPGQAYVRKTELFVKWDNDLLDQSPTIFIRHANLRSTQRVMRQIKKSVAHPIFVLFSETHNNEQIQKAGETLSAQSLGSHPDGIFTTIQSYLRTHQNKVNKHALIISDLIHLPKNEWYENLTGWLTVPEVSGVSGRLIDKNDLIVSSGGLVSDGRFMPLFHHMPRYYQSYIGNAEWVRNLSIVSPLFTAFKIEDVLLYPQTNPSNFDDYFLWLTTKNQKRLVMTPHATAIVYSDEEVEFVREVGSALRVSGRNQSFIDPYSNPNLSQENPHRLFAEEKLEGVDQGTEEPIDMYQHDATILAGTFDVSAEEIAQNHADIAKVGKIYPTSVAWFLPSFDGIYAGLMNIFSFANYLSEDHHLASTFYVLKAGSDASAEKKLVIAEYPKLAGANFVTITPDKAQYIKAHDIGIATQWASAFPLAKANKISRKCYFIQDNEANFYPKGSISALVELSYSFGFMAIAGTQGLLDMYKTKYGGKGIVLKSKVDLSDYHPRENLHFIPEKPYKVFFYARPNMPRNAFELGIAGLKKLKQEMGQEVEITTAGAPWDAKAYEVEGMFTNLGKIAYSAVPKLYRSVDAGLMFMFSGHPGVTASELMASGCPVVVNEYDDATWHELYKHGETCLTTIATASEVARNLKRCLLEKKTRHTLIEGGLAVSQKFYEGYDDSMREAYEAIKTGIKTQ